MDRIFLALLAALAVPAASPAQTSAPAAPPTKSASPPPCASAQHRAFDFWVGSWDVYPAGSDMLIAHSLIERLYGGCAIRENWMPLKGSGGGSLSAFVPD